MLIRQATMNDLDAITEVERVCFLPLEAAPRESFEKRLRAFSDSFLVAEIDGEIVGFVNGCVTNDKVICDEMFKDTSYHDKDGDYQAIFGFAVIPKYRGKGVAQGLMKEIIELARKRGKVGLTLTCKEERIEYYGGYGYEKLGVSESCHGGSVWYDMILILS